MRKLDRFTLIDVLKNAGWKTDKWGHLRKTIPFIKRDTGERVEREYRIKLQATSVRVEVQLRICDANEWRRVGGAYYKSIVQSAYGTIIIGSLKIRGEALV